jgi:hypothetical protein
MPFLKRNAWFGFFEPMLLACDVKVVPHALVD